LDDYEDPVRAKEVFLIVASIFLVFGLVLEVYLAKMIILITSFFLFGTSTGIEFTIKYLQRKKKY